MEIFVSKNNIALLLDKELLFNNFKVHNKITVKNPQNPSHKAGTGWIFVAVCHMSSSKIFINHFAAGKMCSLKFPEYIKLQNS